MYNIIAPAYTVRAMLRQARRRRQRQQRLWAPHTM